MGQDFALPNVLQHTSDPISSLKTGSSTRNARSHYCKSQCNLLCKSTTHTINHATRKTGISFAHTCTFLTKL
ncbi:hypothetical protein BGZ74_001606, partial [Mortierella antarctica]